MFTTKTITYKVGKSLEKVFDKMGETFEEMGNAFAEMEEDNEDDVTITNNRGHIVIVGKVVSLNVNGVTYKIET
jgi:hypothetical protein